MTTERIVIGGGPSSGKTTLAQSMAPFAQSTDDLIDTHDWSAASAAVAEWMLEYGPYVIEGVATARALRKALELTDEAPCDRLIWLRGAWEPLTVPQQAMAKGCETVLAKIAYELEQRGVTIEVRDVG